MAPKIRDEYEIPPQDIYNSDEFRPIDCYPYFQLYSLGSNTNRESVTICETIGGGGCVLPPMIIMIHQEWWFTATDIDHDTLLACF